MSSPDKKALLAAINHSVGKPKSLNRDNIN